MQFPPTMPATPIIWIFRLENFTLFMSWCILTDLIPELHKTFVTHARAVAEAEADARKAP